MVEPVGKDLNIMLKGTNIQLNKNTLKGTVIDKKTPIFMKRFDKDNDGVISEKEAVSMLQKFKKVSGNNVLSEKEFKAAKLGSKEDFSAIGKALDRTAGTETRTEGAETITVTRNRDGSISRTIVNSEDNSKHVYKFDKNGNCTSGLAQYPDYIQQTSFKYDENGNMLSCKIVEKDGHNNITGSSDTAYTYDEAGKPLSAKITNYDKSGKTTGYENVRYETNDDNNFTKISSVYTDAKGITTSESEETYTYDKDGKLSETTGCTKDSTGGTKTTKKYSSDGKTLQELLQSINNSNGTTSIVEQKHNAQGKVLARHITTYDEAGNECGNAEMQFVYADDGTAIQSITMNGSTNGSGKNEQLHYDSSGKLTSIDCTIYKQGAKVEEHYEGANLNNRRNYLPSREIMYESDGKTVKSVTENHFDADGVLISQEVKDKNGNVLLTHDFSKLDGNFDTSFQKGRGDCYLLAAMNSLNASSSGKAALQKLISTGKNSKGETTYTITFPGAKKVREQLIAKGVPEDKIDIKESYTFTESELHEKAKLAGSHYSAGDKDVLLLEAAYEQYRADAKEDIQDLMNTDSSMMELQATEVLHVLGVGSEGGSDNLSTGCEADALYLITGEKSDEFVNINETPDGVPVCNIDSDYNITVSGSGYTLTEEQNAKIDEMFNKIEQDCKDGKLDDYAATLGINISSQTVNGKVQTNGGHALSITKIEGDKVYLKNPWNPTKEVVMTKDEVKKAAKNITLLKLNESSGQNSEPVNPSDEDVTPENPTETTEKPQAGKGYKVPVGKGYKTLLKEALIEQGIEPTAENIAKASEQFKELNEGAVKIYAGKNKKYTGNEFLYADDTVIIPEFKM